MPNTKSAKRRMRNSARKHSHNQTIKSRLKTSERKYIDLIQAGKKEEAALVLREVSSAFDKAAKTGVVPRATASRKRSRLTLRLNALK
ncbi:MAG: 30S ribosomal protein S20 [Chloroflexi bacterium]|nr:30S ribosomal protein S20 [Chloroflexota bacterium]